MKKGTSHLSNRNHYIDSHDYCRVLDLTMRINVKVFFFQALRDEHWRATQTDATSGLL